MLLSDEDLAALIADFERIQREGRIFSIIGVCSLLAARFYYCYLIFYSVWAEPRLIVLLSKIMGGWGGGGCDAMIFAAAQTIFAAAQAVFWPTRVFGVCF